MLINTNYFFTYLALVRRYMLVIRQQWKSQALNAGVRLFIDVIEFGGLYPAMGVPESLIAPIFIGTIALQALFRGMGFALQNLFDIKFKRFIDYHLTLPLPKRWLFAAYITYFCLETAIVTLPVCTVGVVLLGDVFQTVAPQWALFPILYILSLCFYGIFFLGLSMYYEYDWFMQNLWPRRLTFLLLLSPTWFVWHKIYAFSPYAAYLMLANPVTYCNEGLRAILIGGPDYLSAYTCIGALIAWVALAIAFAARGISKRLDPV